MSTHSDVSRGLAPSVGVLRQCPAYELRTARDQRPPPPSGPRGERGGPAPSVGPAVLATWACQSAARPLAGNAGGAVSRGWRWDAGHGGVNVLVVCRGHDAHGYARPGPVVAARILCSVLGALGARGRKLGRMGTASGKGRPLGPSPRRAWAGGSGQRRGLGSEDGLRRLLCFQVTGSSQR